MTKQAQWLRHFHAVLTVFWFAMVPVSLITGWIESIVFIAACSIYANAAAHFGAWQGARAESVAEPD